MPAEQKTPGGVKFDLVWKEPDPEAIKKRPTSPPSNKGTPTLDYINEKLGKAEERRKSLEISKLESISKHNTELIKAKQAKVEEINQAFAKQAAIDLQKKLEKAEELQNKQRLEREQKKLEQEERSKKVLERKKEKGASGDSPTGEFPTSE